MSVVEIPIHIGGQTRGLKFTSEAILVAQSLLPGKMTVREALTLYRDTGTVAICAAAAFRHADDKVSPKRVCGWLDREPGKLRELEAKLLQAAEAHYRHGGLLDDDDPNDGGAAPPAPSPSGSSSLSSPENTG